MEIITTIFNEVLYRPLLNLLIFIYNIIPGHDFGVAIILVTVLIRVILSPLSIKGVKSRKALETLQPKIKEIQKKYKDKQEQVKKMMNFYKENSINPASGCLPLLIQLPIIIALYRVFIGVMDSGKFELLYSFVKSPGHIDSWFLGIIDLAVPSIFLGIIAGAFQFWQSKIMFKNVPKSKTTGKMNIQQTMSRQMIYFMPIITILIAAKLPAGLPLYWAVTTIFGVGEYLLVQHKNEKSKNNSQNN